VKRRETDTLSPAETAKAVRVRRLREDARRPFDELLRRLAEAEADFLAT
jgi:hypothetical protein